MQLQLMNKNLILNTIQKEYRNKGIITLFIFTIMFILAGYGLALAAKEFVIESNLDSFISNTSQGIILNFVAFSTNIVTIIISISSVKSDLQSGLINQLLTLPLSRFSYLISRIFGSWLLSLSFYIVSSVFGILLLLMSGNVNFDFLSYLLSIVFMALQILGMTVMGTVFSLYINKIGSFLFTMFFFVFSKVAYHSITYEGLSFNNFGIFKVLKYFVHFLTPRVGELAHVSTMVIDGSELPLKEISFTTIHFLCLTVVWIFISKLIFEKREF